jgi:hypothetical protein
MAKRLLHVSLGSQVWSYLPLPSPKVLPGLATRSCVNRDSSRAFLRLQTISK